MSWTGWTSTPSTRRAAADSPTSGHVRTRSTRHFVGLSRSTSRCWCGMAEWGNRHAVASHRKRRQQAQ
ncbi:CGNR zinc finger domain-containing protein [Streptomyces nigra]|uniref:CGNR zinc finger domain-containing protein n=1 Tax=Streptomyces nigra TaxID=1827580 RepID=UPI003697FAD6